MHKLGNMLTGWSLQRITKSYEFHQNTWHSGFVSSLSTALLSAACWSIMTCVRAWAGQPGWICGSAGCNALQELFEDLHWILWSLGFRFGQCLQKRPGICKSRCLTSLTLLSDTLSNVQKAINGISWYIIVYHEANAGHSEQGGKVAMPPFEASHSFASPFRWWRPFATTPALYQKALWLWLWMALNSLESW